MIGVRLIRFPLKVGTHAKIPMFSVQITLIRQKTKIPENEYDRKSGSIRYGIFRLEFSPQHFSPALSTCMQERVCINLQFTFCSIWIAHTQQLLATCTDLIYFVFALLLADIQKILFKETILRRDFHCSMECVYIYDLLRVLKRSPLEKCDNQIRKYLIKKSCIHCVTKITCPIKIDCING